jgi:hypothetical protein
MDGVVVYMLPDPPTNKTSTGTDVNVTLVPEKTAMPDALPLLASSPVVFKPNPSPSVVV